MATGGFASNPSALSPAGFASANSAAANAFNQQSANAQMEFQTAANAKAMEFSADQAQKNRDWQQYMSNTAHQREVQDLMAAGLNPVLSATGGNGAAVTSGATASGVSSGGSSASADTSANAAVAQVLSSLWNNATTLEARNIDAKTQLAVAEKYNAVSRYVAELTSATALQNGYTAAEAQRYGANMQYASQKYMSDTNKSIANSNNAAQWSRLQSGQLFDKYMAQNFPNNDVQAIAALLQSVFGGNPVDVAKDWFAGLGDSFTDYDPSWLWNWLQPKRSSDDVSTSGKFGK